MEKQKYTPKKKHTVKKSSGGVKTTDMLKKLQKMLLERSGSISYVFVNERVDNIHSNDLSKMTPIENKSMLHVNLNAQAFYKTDTTLKSPNDLIHMFETMREDIGAKYYIIE